MANLALITPDKYLTERWLTFWEYVNVPEGEKSCWEWTGFCGPSGHGQFFYGKDMKASRAVWIMLYGNLESTDYICHRCDNPRCVRPDHLYKGTHQTNQADKIGKYCNRKATNVKLDWKDVAAIRALQIPAPENRKTIRGQLSPWMHSPGKVAKQFGISPTTVLRIWKRSERGGWRSEVPING